MSGSGRYEDLGDDAPTADDLTPISPYAQPKPPRRESIIPPTRAQQVYPSGLVAKPVEEYLERDDALPIPGAENPGTPERETSQVGEIAAEVAAPRTPPPPPPRSRRWWIIGASIAVGVGVGVVAVALANGGGASPVPSESPTVVPSPDPLTPSFFDDGIADDEYPAPAPTRGTGFPDAFQMEDWVWDRVGPNWAVVIFSDSSYTTTSATMKGAVAYLASPEGQYFELVELPANASDGATIVSWHEDERTARIQYENGLKGGLLNLETGTVDATSFAMSTGRTNNVTFLTANAEGHEVWMAQGGEEGTEFRYFEWSPEGRWDRILAGQDDLVPGWASQVSSDQSAIAFEVYSDVDSAFASDRSKPPGEPQVVIYTVGTLKSNLAAPRPPAGAEYCAPAGWIDSGSLAFGCSTIDGAYTIYRLFLDGSTPAEPFTGYLTLWESIYDQDSYAVPDTPFVLTSAVEDSRIYAVQLVTETGPVTLATDDDPFMGRDILPVAFTRVGEGAYRLETLGGVVVGFDAASGTATPIVPAGTSSGTLLPRTYAFYNEGASPRPAYGPGD